MVALFSLAACGQRPDAAPHDRDRTVKWKAAYSTAECKALTDIDAIIQRCFGGHFTDENYVGDLKCFPYSSPQRFTGVWVVGLESSRFFPNASSYKDTEGRTEKIWLRVEPSPSPAVTAAGQGAGTRAYAVDLIGRRSLCDFNYGHMGMSPKEIIAERIIAMRPLPIPKS